MRLSYLPFVFASLLAGCAADDGQQNIFHVDEQQVVFRVEVRGGRTAVELSELELTPSPTRTGDTVFHSGRFLRRYEFDWSLDELARGTPVTIVSRRGGAVVDTQVLAPYLCAGLPASAEASTVVETHEVEIDEAGALFVDYDLESPLWYSCDTTLGADGTSGGSYLAAPPTCADLPGFDTAVQIRVDGAAPLEPSLCSARQGYSLGVPTELSVVIAGTLPSGQGLTLSFSLCETPADIPLERTIPSVAGTSCPDTFTATMSDPAASGLSSPVELPATGTFTLSAIDDSRDGWLEGALDVSLTGPSGERIEVVGPFRLGTLRM
jgi:hypothetical protein